MVTIYTERGPASETLEELDKPQFHFGRMLAISLGTALLLSLVGTYNLYADVKDLVNNKVPDLQQQISQINPSSLKRM